MPDGHSSRSLPFQIARASALLLSSSLEGQSPCAADRQIDGLPDGQNPDRRPTAMQRGRGARRQRSLLSLLVRRPKLISEFDSPLQGHRLDDIFLDKWAGEGPLAIRVIA